MKLKSKAAVMKAQEKILQFFIRICRFNFGTFEKEDFKKFLRMGSIFALIIGVLFGLRVTDTYFRTFELAIGYSLISVMLSVLGVIAIFVGIILHNLRALVDELKISIQGR